MGFYEQISKYYDIIFPAEMTQLEFIKKYTGKLPKTILDAACGSGEYAARLAEEGYEVTAADIDPSMVELARRKAGKRGLSMVAVEADLRDLGKVFADQSFDTVFCIGNSIVHLDSLQEIERSLGQMRGLLKDGGSVLLQIVNYDRVLKLQASSLPTLTDDASGLEFVRKYRYLKENGKISFDTTLRVTENQEEKVFENAIELYPLLSRELQGMLQRCGYTKIEFFGGFDEKPYHEESFLLVARAQK